MSKPHSAGGIIVRHFNNEVFIVLSDQSEPSDGPKGYWSFPKGHIEEGEDSLTAAYREIYEESGLNSDELTFVGLIGEYNRTSGSPDGKTIVKKITLYHFKTEAENLKSNDERILKSSWIPIDEVAEKLGNKYDAIYFDSIKDKLK